LSYIHAFVRPSVPNRTACSMVTLKAGSVVIPEDNAGEPSAKRVRVESNGGTSVSSQDLMVEVESFASILSNTLDLET
jgi:hypothetical protein